MGAEATQTLPEVVHAACASTVEGAAGPTGAAGLHMVATRDGATGRARATRRRAGAEGSASVRLALGVEVSVAPGGSHHQLV